MTSKMTWESYADLIAAEQDLNASLKLRDEATEATRASAVSAFSQTIKRYKKLLVELGYDGENSVTEAEAWREEHRPELPFTVSAEFLRIERVDERRRKTYGLNVVFLVEVKLAPPYINPFGCLIDPWKTSNANIASRMEQRSEFKASFGDRKDNLLRYYARREIRVARPSEIPVDTSPFTGQSHAEHLVDITRDALHEFITDNALNNRDERVKNVRRAVATMVSDAGKRATRFNEKMEAAKRELAAWIEANEQDVRNEIEAKHKSDDVTMGMLREALASAVTNGEIQGRELPF